MNERRWLLAAGLTALSCSPISCIARGARVRTPRGDRNIETLEVGDEVFALDPDNGALIPTRVTARTSAQRECATLWFGDDSLTCTSDHPLFCPVTRQWAPAGDWMLRRRDHLLQALGERTVPVRVERVTDLGAVHEVFDLTVEHPLHNFVANGVLVHNKQPRLKTCFDEQLLQRFEDDRCWCGDGAAPGSVQCHADGGSQCLCFDAGIAQTNAGTDAGVDGGTVERPGQCPRVQLRGSLPLSYSSDTSSLANLVTSQRLEWGSAPDDSLEFMAPEAGQYSITLTSTVPALGVSAQPFAPANAYWQLTDCPAAGATRELNGVLNHNQPSMPLTLAAGQVVVMFISAPSTANLQQGAYTIEIRKLP